MSAFIFVAAGVERGRGQRRRLQDGKIKNAKQARVVRPHPHKFKSRSTRQSSETFRRVLVRKFGNDLFAGRKMKYTTGDMNGLIGFTDEINLDPAFP